MSDWNISVTAAVHARLKARAVADGDSMARIVEEAVAPVFSMSEAEQAELVERIRRRGVR